MNCSPRSAPAAGLRALAAKTAVIRSGWSRWPSCGNAPLDSVCCFQSEIHFWKQDQSGIL